MDALKPGTLLNSHYRIEEVVGRGSFGITYRVKDTEDLLEKNIALKECFPCEGCTRNSETGRIEAAAPEEYNAAIASMLEEAYTLASIKHPGVVAGRVTFYCEATNSVFCGMEWVEGKSLHGKMEEVKNGQAAVFSTQTLQKWLMSILDALKCIHNNKVMHLDIKPANIMFDKADNPILVDFGAALNRNLKEGLTIVSTYTPAYAAPEQISGRGKIGPWTDFYSLAATFYEMLTGHPVAEYGRGDIPEPENAGEPLAKTIMRNLSFAPKERCQSADEWFEMLVPSTQQMKSAMERLIRDCCKALTQPRKNEDLCPDDVRSICDKLCDYWTEHCTVVPEAIAELVQKVKKTVNLKKIDRDKSLTKSGAVLGGAAGVGAIAGGAAVGAGVGQGVMGAIAAALFGGPVVLPVALMAGGGAAIGLAAKAWLTNAEKRNARKAYAQLVEDVGAAVEQCWPEYKSRWKP